MSIDKEIVPKCKLEICRAGDLGNITCDGCGRLFVDEEKVVWGIESCCGGGCARTLCATCVAASWGMITNEISIREEMNTWNSMDLQIAISFMALPWDIKNVSQHDDADEWVIVDAYKRARSPKFANREDLMTICLIANSMWNSAAQMILFAIREAAGLKPADGVSLVEHIANLRAAANKSDES